MYASLPDEHYIEIKFDFVFCVQIAAGNRNRLISVANLFELTLASVMAGRVLS